MTYTLVSGTLDTIQLTALDGSSTPCEVGDVNSNCLTSAPLAIDAATITIDLATNQVLDLGIFVA